MAPRGSYEYKIPSDMKVGKKILSTHPTSDDTDETERHETTCDDDPQQPRRRRATQQFPFQKAWCSRSIIPSLFALESS